MWAGNKFWLIPDHKNRSKTIENYLYKFIDKPTAKEVSK